MIEYEKVYDISVLLGTESIDYPGDTPYSIERICRIKDDGVYNLSRLVMSAHSGTHIDVPSHFIENAKSIDQYPVQKFIFPALMISIEDRKSIRPSEIENLDIRPGDALLFQTDNSISGRCRSGMFSEDFVFLSLEAAEFCASKGVRLIGLDYITIEEYGDQSFATHRMILGNDILILEGIDLKEVPSGRYTLFCLPLRIKGAEASPVRAVLLS